MFHFDIRYLKVYYPCLALFYSYFVNYLHFNAFIPHKYIFSFYLFFTPCQVIKVAIATEHEILKNDLQQFVYILLENVNK